MEQYADMPSLGSPAVGGDMLRPVGHFSWLESVLCVPLVLRHVVRATKGHLACENPLQLWVDGQPGATPEKKAS